MNSRLFPKKHDAPLFIACLLLLTFYTLIAFYFSYIATNTQQQYSLLAESFIRGRLYFLSSLGLIEDAAFWKGQFYWPLGPLPSVVLVPFVFFLSLFNIFFYQGYMQFVLNGWIFYFAYKLAIKLGWKTSDAFFLAFGFMFASVYQMLSIMSWSWYFVQVLCTLILFLIIYEYIDKRRMFIIGIYIGLLFLSRFTAGLGAIAFVSTLVLSSKSDKAKNLFIVAVPVFASGIILLTYNYLRFGNIWQNGYDLTNNLITNASQRYELLNHGLFKLSNIPTNFYYYFIKTLDPVLIGVASLFGNTHFLEFPYITLKYPGTSFFVVSPLFLYLFKTSLKSKLAVASLCSVLVVLPIFLSYYWPGWRQVGPRYLVDILPFLYILLLNSFKKMTLGTFPKILVLVSSIINFYLFVSVFNG